MLHGALATADLAPFRVVMLPAPDINIVCYVLTHPELGSLRQLNDFNQRVYQELSLARPGGAPEYIITRTRLKTPMYDGAVDPILSALGTVTTSQWKAAGDEGLVVLRSTVMDPFLAEASPAPDHVTGLINAIRRAAQTAFEEMEER